MSRANQLDRELLVTFLVFAAEKEKGYGTVMPLCDHTEWDARVLVKEFFMSQVGREWLR